MGQNNTMGTLTRLCRRIRKSKSGNAALMVGLGLPALIGGTGFAVDTAQWYLWKRELQYAVDQAAIAGAWSRAAGTTGTEYQTRATQEFDANLAVTSSFAGTPTIALASYGSGTDNAVVVSASASKTLPFSSFVTGKSATINVTSQAMFERGGASYNPCMLALDPSASSAMLLNGNVTVTATCGIGAISDAADAVSKVGGAGNVDVGFVITSGGISDQHGHFDQETKIAGTSGLEDPYEDLTPPDNSTPRSLSCATSSATYTADVTRSDTFSYDYWRGSNTNNVSSYNYSPPQASRTVPYATTTGSYTSYPTDSSTTTESWTILSGNGRNRIWERELKVETISYKNVTQTGGTSNAMLPGTYTDFTISCDTILSGGVYVLDGTDLKISGQHELTGSGVMFVLKNGAGIQITGGAEVELTAMTKNELMALGISSDDAEALEGMLVFEDENSSAGQENKMTGNSTSVWNGIIYMPNSDLKISGTPEGTSQCMVLAAKTLKFAGNVDVTSLCPSGMTPAASVYEPVERVRLVK